MRRCAALLFALVLVAAACGDDDDAGSTTLPQPTTATLAPPTTEAATSSTAASTTTTAAAPVTTRQESDALSEAALAFAGGWVGQWNNTTFGSTGSVDAFFDVFVDDELAVITLDLGGFVFGGPDPDPVVLEFDLSASAPFEGSYELFGDSTIEIGPDGLVTMTAHAVPGLDGLILVAEGTPDPAGYQMTYTIENPDGSVFTEGFMDLAPAG